MTKIKQSMIWGCLIMMAAFFLLSTGCSGLRSGDAGAKVASPGTPGSSPLYYGFNDVLVPGELREDKKSSYVVQSHGFSAGILSFRGRVERGSLIAFFKENMEKDKWETIGSFVSSRTILLFQKENRWCVINISEGDFYTHVEVGVVHTSKES